MFKQSANLFLKFVIGILMCLFVFMSFSFAFSAAFSDTVGYNIYHYNAELGKEELVCVHNEENKNDVDCKCGEYASDELNAVRLTELSSSKKKVCNILAQIFSLVLISGVIYGTVWEKANKDISAVKFERVSENKWRGLIMGSIASIPSCILFVLLILSKFEILSPNFLSTYRLLNSHFHGILTLIYSSASSAADLSDLQILYCGLLLLYLPVLCGVAYLLGYKDIKIFEKIVYKKKV